MFRPLLSHTDSEPGQVCIEKRNTAAQPGTCSWLKRESMRSLFFGFFCQIYSTCNMWSFFFCSLVRRKNEDLLTEMKDRKTTVLPSINATGLSVVISSLAHIGVPIGSLMCFFIFVFKYISILDCSKLQLFCVNELSVCADKKSL